VFLPLCLRGTLPSVPALPGHSRIIFFRPRLRGWFSRRRSLISTMGPRVGHLHDEFLRRFGKPSLVDPVYPKERFRAASMFFLFRRGGFPSTTQTHGQSFKRRSRRDGRTPSCHRASASESALNPASYQSGTAVAEASVNAEILPPPPNSATFRPDPRTGSRHPGNPSTTQVRLRLPSIAF